MSGSMFGQDEFVISALGEMQGGYFLDSGASDGVQGSNTIRLEEEYGWSGICVEPNDWMYSLLERNRDCHKINCCLYRANGETAFMEAGVLGGIYDEYHPELLGLARHVYAVPDVTPGIPATVTKKTRTPRAVLEAFGAPRVIDYWSLDTEGSELSILKAFPFEDYTVRIITVEHNHYPVREEIRLFLEGLGYQRVCALHVDDCYVLDVALPPALWRSAAWRR